MGEKLFLKKDNFVGDYVGNINLECDFILGYLYFNKDKESSFDQIVFECQKLSIDATDVISVLKNDEFIVGYKKDGEDMNYFQITFKGIAFYKTDCYIDRQKRWDLEKATKRLEYVLKSKTFAISIIAIIISLGAATISLITLLAKLRGR